MAFSEATQQSGVGGMLQRGKTQAVSEENGDMESSCLVTLPSHHLKPDIQPIVPD